ncbi:hypothetical protein F5X68DRAFT_18344 [Plectosphaerella plurivora]|uniref:Uncharacterized protein n=1 Tax=Plectosphaerella plurivora TaxID=936078 RepID=A0A9P8V9B2_9PEZI|nr:hypothetical protein F5X68DRAFT_18344 [Plectosphaerella plurivora]
MLCWPKAEQAAGDRSTFFRMPIYVDGPFLPRQKAKHASSRRTWRRSIDSGRTFCGGASTTACTTTFASVPWPIWHDSRRYFLGRNSSSRFTGLPFPRDVLCQGSTYNMRSGMHCVFFPRLREAVGLDDLSARLCIFCSSRFTHGARRRFSLHSSGIPPGRWSHGRLGRQGSSLGRGSRLKQQHRRQKGVLDHLPWRALRRVDFSRRNGWHVGVPCLLSLCSEFGSFDSSYGYEHAVPTAWLHMRFPRPQALSRPLGGRHHGVQSRQAMPPFAIPRQGVRPGYGITTVGTMSEGKWRTSNLCTVSRPRQEEFSRVRKKRRSTEKAGER